MKLKILVDNQAMSNFRAEWGFSCLVEAKENVLFDTGTSADVLAFNAEKFGIKPEQISKVVLSHDHFDHTGGLEWVLQNPKVKVFVLDSFSDETKQSIEKKAELIEVSKPVEISRSVFSTGKLSNSIDEQGLVLEVKEGVIVLVGCSHPGLEKILKKARKYGRIHAVIGGFHDFNKFDALEKVKIIAGTHCTEHKTEIQKLFPKAFTECSAGTEFEF